MVMVLERVKFDEMRFLAGRIWNIFAYSFTIIQAIDKWGLQVDSTHRIDIQIPFQDVLTVDGDGYRGG